MKKRVVGAFVLILFASFVVVSAGECADPNVCRASFYGGCRSDETIVGFCKYGPFSISGECCAPAEPTPPVGCDGGDDQTIMRLSGDTNAHVSAWNETVDFYTNEICYDDDELFGFTYDAADPHKCNGMNTIVNVYDLSNSHASNISNEIYDKQICYGNLQCVYDSSEGAECAIGGDAKVIARMYSSYNSHLASRNKIAYPVKICCDDIYWAGLDGKIISEADFGDTIFLVAPIGTSGEFEIKEADTIWEDGFGAGDDSIRFIDGDNDGVNYMAKWTITEEDLAETRDFEQFYFEVGSRRSADLKINLAARDDPMSVKVVQPSCGEYFDEGEFVDIIVEANDTDDVIEGVVTINEEEIRTFDNGRVIITREFKTPGEYQIVVNATNSRGKVSRHISNIMILKKDGDSYVDGNYTAACIASPEDYGDFEETLVRFNASTSMGVKVEGGVLREQIPGRDPFIWDWTFDAGPGVDSSRYWDDSGEGGIEGGITEAKSYGFTLIFPSSGQKSATLEVSLP